MGSVLLMPLSVRTIPKANLEVLRKEHLSRFVNRTEKAMKRAEETDNFTHDTEDDLPELIDFYDACEILYLDNEYEINNIHKDLRNYIELNNKYGEFIKPDQRYIEGMLLVFMREFDSGLDGMIANEFQDMNLIIKRLNHDQPVKNWYQLYDFYQMLHMDSLASIVASKMSDMGDEFAKTVLENEKYKMSFTELAEISKKETDSKEK